MTDVQTTRETWEKAAHADLAHLAAREADEQTSVAVATRALAAARKGRAKARAEMRAAHREYERKGLPVEPLTWADGTTDGAGAGDSEGGGDA